MRRYWKSAIASVISFCAVTVLVLSTCPPCQGQASDATLGGVIEDRSGAVIPHVAVKVTSVETGVTRNAMTNNSGVFSVPGLNPGSYSVHVEHPGFADVEVKDITLNVGSDRQLEIKLALGRSEQSVTVDGGGLQINTTDGSVSTVIDRQFVANIPLNGRSFQDLISMTPGVVTQSPQNAGSSPGSSGDFSINGQRTESNYYLVDGVSANATAGPSQNTGYGVAGVMAATSALGTTQSLLSVDDLQEFRVESSSYSAEYGRSPGGQLTFVTRSGTNSYHGSAYEYFRNGWFDANDWFNDHVGQPKQQLHQSDFGGTLGGPIWFPGLYKGTDRTFFFGSYEGLRLAEPVAATVQYVPDTYMREQASAVVQPLMNAFPKPNGIDYGNSASPSFAQFFQGYSLPGSINSSSIRIDQTFTPTFSAFFRFADTPSSIDSRSFSILTSGQMNVQTYTLGTTNILSPSATNQFRLGYTRSESRASSTMDSFGGAEPIDLGEALGNTTGVTGRSAEAFLFMEAADVGYAELETPANETRQHQWNLTDAIDITHGTQQWKFGIDFRRVSTIIGYAPTVIGGLFFDVNSALTNNADEVEYEKNLSSQPTFNQFALFAQDDWRLNSRLSLSGGLRWELLPPPHNATNPQPYTVVGSLAQPATLELAPAGTPLWHTSWFSLAPRLGLAWQANTSKHWETVVRGGGGVFFDTVNELASDAFGAFGFSAIAVLYSAALPLTPAQQNITITTTPPYADLLIYPSHLQNPYTLQWNTSIEQGLGSNNVATISYVGSAGRRLAATQELNLGALNPQFETVYYIADNVTSDYDALQAKLQRSVTKGLNALASYTWAHSIDYGSNASALPLTRGNSDFDVRNNFQVGITWELPHLAASKLMSTALNGWGFDGRLLARTSFPITLQGNEVTDPTNGSQYFTNVNLVPGQPIYLHGGQYPGGRSLNPAAFAYPTGTNPGTAPRNFARGFGESQLNFAARRDFALSESTHLQFRAEAFNVLNHPNFGYVDPNLTDATFGQATMMLNQSLGTVASQYQQGGPRSMQFSLRLAF